MTGPHGPAAASVAPAARAWGDPWRLTLLTVAGLTLLRLALLFLGGHQLYGDEAQYWSYGEELAWGHYSKPPLIGWVMKLTTEIGGLSEAWVRIASPLCHAGAALLLFALTRRLFDAPTAALAAIGYASLPAVSYATLLFSTDTPLLLFWCLALLALWRLQAGGGAPWAVAFGVALAGGLLSKYAMGYLFVGLAVWALLAAEGRRLWRRPALWAGLGLGLLLFAPNLWWNLQHGAAAFVHVVEDARPPGPWLRPFAAMEFFGAQLGVVGPVYLVAVLARLALWRSRPPGAAERFLIAMSVPVLALLQLQALHGTANANWAAVAVPAAVVLATAWLSGLGRWLWLRVALGINAVAQAGLVLLVLVPGIVTGVAGADALDKLRGWDSFAARVQDYAGRCGCDTILFDHRFDMAQYWFYADADPARLRMWVTRQVSNHYELAYAYDPQAVPADARVLYVTDRPNAQDVLAGVGRVLRSWHFEVPKGPGVTHAYRAFVLAPEEPAGAE